MSNSVKKKQIRVRLPEEVVASLERLAASKHLEVHELGRVILCERVDLERKEHPELFVPEAAAAAA